MEVKYAMVSAMAIDTYMWQEGSATAQDNATEKHYAFYSGKRAVGHATVRVLRHVFAFREQQQFFPNAWFQGESGLIGGYYSVANLKPILNITRYDFKEHQGQGYGRAGLQKMYLLSRRLGCEGRIVLTATNNAGSFYEHCGFYGLNPHQDGEKYFNPQSQTLRKLFAKNNIKNITLQEIPPTANNRSVHAMGIKMYPRLEKIFDFERT